MKKILVIALVVVMLVSIFALTACDKEVVLTGEYEETFGKNQDLYVTKVVVTVKGDIIVKVEMAEDSNHYTKESAKWASTNWTDAEESVLASFAGKSVSELLAATENAVFESVSSATVTGNRVYQAVIAALKTK